MEQLANFGAGDGGLMQFGHRVQPLLDFRYVERGPQQCAAQQPSAHAGDGLIQDP